MRSRQLAMTPSEREPTAASVGSRLVARNALFRTGGEVVAKLAAVAFYVAVARELGESGFGDFMFALSFTGVLILSAGLGTEELLAREVSRDRERVHSYLTNVVAIKALVSLAILVLAGLIVNLLGYPAEVRLAVYVIGVGVAVENLGRSWHSVFQAFERMEFISVGLILQRVLTAAAGIAALAAGAGLVAVCVVYTAGCVIGFLVQLWSLRRFVVRPRLEMDRSRWWPLMKAGVPIGLVTVLFTVLMKVDQSLLSFLGDDNVEVGLYGAAFRLVESTMFIPWAFGMAMLPWMARQTGEPGGQLARGYGMGLTVMLGVLLPVGLTYALFGDSLINLFYGERYADATLPLQLLGGATVFYALNSLAGMLLIARDRPGDFSKLLGLVAAVNIVMNVALIPTYGADGAALAASVSGLLLGLFAVWRVRTVVGQVSLIRSASGPVAGGAAMTVTALALPLAFVPDLLVSGLVYAAVFALVEATAFPDDFDQGMRLLRRRGRPTAGEPVGVPESSVPTTA